ncbi:hypothetical protein FFF34_008500 [Inquilinus sp. KBS0705]|nr:hypothetical protein FFF34_008500 [Inquilinus sp. KBS0705]
MTTTIKKLSAIILTATLLTAATACHNGPSTTIVTHDDNNYQKIEYAGRVVFNQDQTAIEDISTGGHLYYEHNGKKFKAQEGAMGRIYYSFNGDSEVNSLSAEQKALVAEAIKEIVKQRAKRTAN